LWIVEASLAIRPDHSTEFCLPKVITQGSVLRLNPIPMLSANARRQQHYAYLMEQAKGLANDDPLARLVASYYSGFGTMPEALGLATLEFKRLLDRHFPGLRLPIAAPRPVPLWDPRLVEEKEELIKLMNGYRAGADESELWMSVIVATGCLANDHLWQDLGLWSRNDLSALMTLNFPGLAAKNDRDMKWKKFLYKQLCIQEGITLCRAPSCEVCSDYLNCFGLEA
jgi:nitrogen fixation protein NifQ